MTERNEIELKLECEPSDLAALQSHSALQGAVRQGEVELTSTYHDTADRRLRAAGFVLRVRRSGGRCVQTLKADGEDLLDRPEWEWEITGSEPNREVLAETPLAKVLAHGGALRPLFTTIVTRRTDFVERDGACVEVALDTGWIEAPAAGSRTVPICEIEFELKKGAVGDVFAPARAVAAVVPLRLGVGAWMSRTCQTSSRS